MPPFAEFIDNEAMAAQPNANGLSSKEQMLVQTLIAQTTIKQFYKATLLWLVERYPPRNKADRLVWGHALCLGKSPARSIGSEFGKSLRPLVPHWFRRMARLGGLFARCSSTLLRDVGCRWPKYATERQWHCSGLGLPVWMLAGQRGWDAFLTLGTDLGPRVASMFALFLHQRVEARRSPN